MKKIICLIFILFLLGILFCNCIVFSKDINKESSFNFISYKDLQGLKKFENNMVFYQNNISFNLKIREEDGEWEDKNLTTYAGSIIEFKIEIDTKRGYPLSLSAALILPITLEDKPIFDYIENSEYTSKKTFLFEASDEEVLFLWYPVLVSTSITCTFKARIREVASEKEISGLAFGIIDSDYFDYENDSVNITSKIPPYPNKPEKPQGNIDGFVSDNYTYFSSATDPYNSDLYYRFDWGDNTFSKWIGSYPSGISVQTNKSWDYAGNFFIKVQAKNEEGFPSDWSDSLIVNIKEKVEIIKPVRGLYIGNSKLFNLPLIFIIGKINIEVITPGIPQVGLVEFYVNGDLKYVDDINEDEKFSWLWTDRFFGKFDLKINVYDYYNNSWVLEISGYKFL